ncbi:TonB-dependent receptor [Pseudobacter ginsenosidimutans]|uniref:TonB-dependent receptor n=1 Tax=Pseudobacter ginsenosidimutans TaxID=661488 RepID=A0A4Q7MUR4_9BACT|nr:TonB-dependent receptor [Pseudobacter ginsenosidimutans]QEC40624.1 TonB-dependent receptor [Pseudobacter ginsenosidimutans]RZS72656.1 TonB-dependent receptor [Pseudobacter ginsenosidimutans]
MKKLYAVLVATLLTSIAMAQSAIIKIKVTDEQRLLLPGASIQLDEKGARAVSGNDGIATLMNVPNGKHTITVTYIGYQTLKLDFENGGKPVELTAKLQSGSNSLQSILVMGDRMKGQAKALNQQKNSDNITNIISADQIGRFPDANIGDAIKRVPGITMQNDQGEARNIVVRGMGPEFNSVTFNGERIPSAEGDNRRIQMDLIPTDMVQTVEVNKTLTADMDADAIGGSVNLVTRSTPGAFRLSGTLAGGFSPIRDNGWNGTASVVIGTRVLKDKLGMIFSGSYNRNKFGSDNVEAVWSKDANGKVFVNDHDVRVYDELRIRRSAAATFDYKINALHTLTLTGSYNWRDDKESRFRLRHRFRGKLDDIKPGELIYDDNGEITGFNNGEVLRQTKGGADNNRSENRRLEDQRVRSLALKGDHIFGRLRANWSAQYAKASEKRPNERYIAMRRRNITVDQSITDAKFPVLSDNTPLSGYDKLDELTEQFQDQFEEDFNGKLNLEYPVSIIPQQKGWLKLGGRIRSKTKERNNTFFEYEPVDFADNISELPLVDKTNSSFYPGSKYKAGQFIDPKYLGGLNFKDPAQFEETDAIAEYLSGNYKAKELITAGFLMLKQDITEKFSVNLGIRVEHTNIDYTGNIIEDEDVFKGQAPEKNSYTDVLPNINLKYRFSNYFVMKAAWTNTLARPKYFDLVPYFNVKPGDNEIEAGNPTLEPVKSSNLDLMAEYYFKTVGIVSAGVFYKKLDGFFYTYIDNNFTSEKFARAYPDLTNPIAPGDNYTFIQRRNGDGADVYGFEVAVQRQLDFLPGFWKGFGVYFNYTYTHSKAKSIYDAEGTLVRNNVKLPGAAPNIFNASLSYETKRFSARLSANYTSSYVDDSDDAGYNADSFYDRFYDKQFFLDANASYAITPKWRIFAEANNLTNQPLRYYQGEKNRTAQVEYYGSKFNLGVKFDLVK